MPAETSLYNQEAESILLAAMLRYPDDYFSINDIGLVPTDFVGPENRKVFKAIYAVAGDKRVPTMPFVLEEVRVSGSDTTVEYLSKLAEVPASVPQAKEMAQTVKGLATSRNLANVGAKIIELARTNRSDYRSALSEADTLLWQVKQDVPDERGVSAADILERMATSTQASTIPIRFSPTLNDITMGYEAGMFWVVGGFSSVGKSAVAVNMALDGLRARKSVGIASLEMTQETYVRRFLSNMTGIPYRDLRQGIMLPMDSGVSLGRAKASLSRSNLFIEDSVSTLDRVKSFAVRLKETRGLDMFLVDFIQNVRAGGDEFSDARTVALELQSLAKELECTVIAFSQVSNEQAKLDASGGAAGYYSFKGHGAIRDAADVGIMLQRDRAAGSPVLNLKVVKNRHDAMRDVACHMELETGRITELDGDYEGD